MFHIYVDYKMSSNDVHLTRRHMTTLIEFARALRTSIQNINENSYNNFITRIGINIGPVVAGKTNRLNFEKFCFKRYDIVSIFRI